LYTRSSRVEVDRRFKNAWACEKLSWFVIMNIVRKLSTSRHLTRIRLFEDDSHVRYNNQAVGRQWNSRNIRDFSVTTLSGRFREKQRIVQRRTVPLIGYIHDKLRPWTVTNWLDRGYINIKVRYNLYKPICIYKR